MGTRGWQHRIIQWMLLAALLCTTSAVTAWWSARQSTAASLQAVVPEALAETLRYSLADDQVLSLVASHLDDDLQELNVHGRTPMLQSCKLVRLRLSGASPQPTDAAASLIPDINIAWYRGEQPEFARFRLYCELDHRRWLGSNAALSLLVMMLVQMLPPALSAPQRAHYQQLLDRGIQPGEARGLVRFRDTLDADARRWYDLGLQHLSPDESPTVTLKRVSQAPATLHFQHAQHTVQIHGITIRLSKTPYFYYAWYARQRKHSNDDGWVLNPASERPDPVLAVSLLELMTHYGGHQKAINDLREHGLRSKLLDQNRNKIKDELTATLGEALAGEFLFEAERDLRTGRHRYRLACPPERIFAG